MSNITLEQAATIILNQDKEKADMETTTIKKFLLELDYKQIENYSQPRVMIRKAFTKYQETTRRLKQVDDPIEIQKLLGSMVDQLMVCVLVLFNKNLK